MFKKIRTVIFSLLVVLLWARFLLAVGDPVLTGQEMDGTIPIYTGWRPIINGIYQITNILMWPIDWPFRTLIQGLLPPLHWFPTYNVDQLVQDIMGNQALKSIHPVFVEGTVQKTLRGQFQWLVFVVMGLLSLIGPLLDSGFDFLKNLIWNVLIEFSFTKKKQKVYQEKLEQRATDLLKLKVEYKNLSKETDKLAEAVIKDELTGIYNKRFFIQRAMDEFNQAKARKTHYSIVMIDIDHFKRLNDTYGHLMGDVVLKQVADEVRKGTPSDCYACRFGGEEFSIIMPGKNPTEAKAIAERVHQKIPALKYDDVPDLTVTISMGLLSANFANEPAQALEKFDDAIKLADDELYRAKLGGRNRIEHNILA